MTPENPLLTRLGLRGSYQVHQAPALLVPDHRAHQVFVGFTDGVELKRRLLERLPPSAPLFRISESEEQLVCLEEMPEALSETWVLPAQDAENPGGLYGLVWVVDRLLGPGGCPWDQKQTHETLKKHLLEESYELLDAIDQGDEDGMREELGDVLLQPVMHTQIKWKEGHWGIDAAAAEIVNKLVRRHPHVFGDAEVEDADAVLKNWDRIKKEEKGEEPRGALDGVPAGMASLLRAYEVSKRAARQGFDWPDRESIWSKFHEEEREVREAIDDGDRVKIEAEIGDLLFTVVNIARWCQVEPEEALRKMLNRFQSRFTVMEQHADKPLSELNAQEWDDLWNRAKATSKPAGL